MTLVAEVGALTYEPFIGEELGRVNTDECELRGAVRVYLVIDAGEHARRLLAELAGSAPAAGGSGSTLPAPTNETLSREGG